MAVFSTGADRGHAGIWQAGSGPVGVGDRIYVMTGNGPARSVTRSSRCRVSDSPPGLTLAAAHQPSNHETLDRTDSDLGSGGPLWLPPGVIVGGGKEGRYEVLDARTLALSQDEVVTQPRLNPKASRRSSTRITPIRARPPATTQPRSTFPTNCDTGTVPGCYVDPARYQDGEDCGPNVNAGPVFWAAAGPGYGLVYQMAGRDYLKAFRYDTATHHLDERPFLTSSVRAVEGMSGGFSSLSADGARDGILWVSYPLGDGQWQNVPGRLAAFDATTLAELWHDDGGYLFAKFTPPTIASGRVIRATLSGKVVVYGLRAGRRAAVVGRARGRPAGGAVPAAPLHAPRAGRTRRGRREVPAGRRRERLSGQADLRRPAGPGRRRRMVPGLSGRHHRRRAVDGRRPALRAGAVAGARGGTRGWGWGRRSLHPFTGRNLQARTS